MGAMKLAADWRRPDCRGHSNRRDVGVIGAPLKSSLGGSDRLRVAGLRVVQAAGYRNDKSRRRWSPGAGGFGVGRCFSTWRAEGGTSRNIGTRLPEAHHNVGGMYVSSEHLCRTNACSREEGRALRFTNVNRDEGDGV